ncbi:MAG: carbon monoxide dehydrogenase subunit G [Mariniblastus sp.]|jgi:carbon monoxide dehydrogenase subunit G
MNLLHRIGATFGGVLAGLLSVFGVESISSMIYKMPDGLELDDHEGLEAWIGTLPIGAFLFILVAWSCGCFLAAFVARRLAPQRSAYPGLVACSLLTLGSIWSLITIPHPIWFSVIAIPMCLVFGLLGLVAAAPKFYAIKCNRTIIAPIDKVFKTLATIDEFSKAVPGIQSVEFLSKSHYGVGTRFRETRLMNGKEVATELEVTELVENEHVRMVSDAGGTIWDTTFRVKQNGDVVEMAMQMDALPHNFSARLITPLILGMVSKFVGQDMDSVKEFCEQEANR